VDTHIKSAAENVIPGMISNAIHGVEVTSETEAFIIDVNATPN